MRYLLVFVFSFLFVQGVFAQIKNRRVVEFSGTISKYPIKMVLVIEKENIYGYYFYESVKTKILLTGELKGTKVLLNESPGYEENTFENKEAEFRLGFKGELKDSLFLGYWFDNDNKKKLTLKLKKVSDKSQNQTQEISSVDGYYNNINNSDKANGSIRLSFIKDDLFYFETFTGTETGCMGYLNGLVNIKDFKSGSFSSEFCRKFSLKFGKSTLQVTEENCEAHGARCGFDGTYKKMLEK